MAERSAPKLRTQCVELSVCISEDEQIPAQDNAKFLGPLPNPDGPAGGRCGRIRDG